MSEGKTTTPCGQCGQPTVEWGQLPGEVLRCTSCLARELLAVRTHGKTIEGLAVAFGQRLTERQEWERKIELFGVILNSRHLRPRGETAEETMDRAARWAGMAWDAFVSVHPVPKGG